MQTKLTLRLDDSLIEAAKQEAERRGMSLSRLVADLFRSLKAAKGGATDRSVGSEARSATNEDALRPLGARTQRLLGVLREAGVDADASKRHLEEKHLS